MVDIEVSQETTNRLHAILSGLGKADEKSIKACHAKRIGSRADGF